MYFTIRPLLQSLKAAHSSIQSSLHIKSLWAAEAGEKKNIKIKIIQLSYQQVLNSTKRNKIQKLKWLFNIRKIWVPFDLTFSTDGDWGAHLHVVESTQLVSI